MEWTLRVVGNDETRTATVYNRHGVIVETRPYNEAENAAADERAESAARTQNAVDISSKLITRDLPAMQAILDQTNADIRTDPAQEVKDIARAVRRLVRKVEGLLDGSD